jgi:hypothetical protein
MTRKSESKTKSAPVLVHADAVPETRLVVYVGGKSETPYGGLGTFVKGIPRQVPANEVHKFMHTMDFKVLDEILKDGED